MLGNLNRSNLIAFSLVLIIFLQNPPWFLWGVNYSLLPLSILAMVLLVVKGSIKSNLLVPVVLSFFVILHFALYQALIANFQLSTVGVVLTFLALFHVDEKDKIRALGILTNVVAIVVAVSLPLWALSLFYNFLPFSYIDYGDWKGSDNALVIRNYYLFLLINDFDIFRFYSVFDEPGVLGTICSFLLLGNRYDFSKGKNIVIFIGGVFTFSLAFYVLTVIGFLMVRTGTYLARLRQVLTGLFAVVVLFFLLSSFEAFEASIVGKFSNLVDGGGLNRNSIEIDRYFDQFLTTINVVLGNGGGYVSAYFDVDVGQSYKLFLIQFGIYGLLLVFLMYLLLVKGYADFKFVCLLIFFTSFIQRPFLFTPWQLVMFAIVASGLNGGRRSFSIFR